MMGEFRRASNEFRSTIESEVEAEKIRESMRIEPRRSRRWRRRRPARGRRLPGEPVHSGGRAAGVHRAARDRAARDGTSRDRRAGPETVSRQPDNTPIEPK